MLSVLHEEHPLPGKLAPGGQFVARRGKGIEHCCAQAKHMLSCCGAMESVGCKGACKSCLAWAVQGQCAMPGTFSGQSSMRNSNDSLLA